MQKILIWTPFIGIIMFHYYNIQGKMGNYINDIVMFHGVYSGLQLIFIYYLIKA